MSVEYHKIYISEALKIVNSLARDSSGWVSDVDTNRIEWFPAVSGFTGFYASSAKQVELLLVENILAARPDDENRASMIQGVRGNANLYKKSTKTVLVPYGNRIGHVAYGFDFQMLKLMSYSENNLFIVVDHDDAGECDTNDWPATCPHCQSPARIGFNLLCSNPACK